MKVLLILAHTGARPTVFNRLLYKYYQPSLTLEQIIAITPDRYELDVIDGRCEKINYEWDGDIVGISSRTVAARTAYSIADEFRRRGKKVVLGGWHPSLMPDEAKKHADSVVIGEAEISWPRLLKDFEKGEMKSFYQSKLVEPDKISSPERRIQKHDLVCAPIQATRGCPYGCKFCPVNKIQGRKLRMRPIEQVIEEIKSIKSKRLFFVDNSLTINREYTKKLFKEMIGLNKKFSCYGNINVLGKDDELLQLAKDAGCEIWIIGFESISQDTMDNIGKITNKVKGYKNAIKKIHDYNMTIQGLFVFGFDDDTLDVFDKTLNAAYRWKIDKVGFAILTPFPGTSLYKKLENEGRIISKDWSKYNLKNPVFQPKNMAPQQLYNETNRVLNDFYSVKNVMKRNINDPDLSLKRIINRTISEYSSIKLYKIYGF